VRVGKDVKIEREVKDVKREWVRERIEKKVREGKDVKREGERERIGKKMREGKDRKEKERGKGCKEREREKGCKERVRERGGKVKRVSEWMGEKKGERGKGRIFESERKRKEVETKL
jgi:hypothetical protein